VLTLGERVRARRDLRGPQHQFMRDGLQVAEGSAALNQRVQLALQVAPKVDLSARGANESAVEASQHESECWVSRDVERVSVHRLPINLERLPSRNG